MLPIKIQCLSFIRWIIVATTVASFSLAGSITGYSKGISGDLRPSETTDDYQKANTDKGADQLDALSIDSGPSDKSQAPYDPCQPGLYRDWLEFSIDQDEFRKTNNIIGARILIDRARFEIRIEALLKDGTTREFYSGAVALGAFKSPTPNGHFIINHVFCYPDVIFFASESQPIPNLYRGFFAPLQICDEYGHCERYHDLGIHGFQISAHPHPETLQSGLYGPVSGGCVRVADPCALKRHLIRLVGVGKLRKNDRGSYHWLNKNVEVMIFDEESGPDETLTIAKILEDGLTSLGSGLRSVMNVFQP